MHRDVFDSCPRCTCGLDIRGTRLSCGQCGGTLVPEQELLDEIGTQQATALLRPRTDWAGVQRFATFVYELPAPIASRESPMACPRCGVPMTTHVLFDVLIDRCLAHGVWVGGDHELRAILGAATAGL